MKILISTWGNPKGWEEVTYCYKESRKRLKDVSPLIKEKEGIEKTIIVSIDTLSDECVSCLLNSLYRDIKNLSYSLIQNFCREEIGYTPDRIIISYGVGEFNNSKFAGNAMDFYYSVFKELSFTFVEWLDEFNGNRIEIYLDISHGINFLPVLTYRALKEMLQILAYGFSIKFTVLNSDTYIRTARPDFLNINIIEKSKILPKLTVYKIDKRPIEPYFGLIDEEKGKIGKNLQSFDKNILYFLSSFMYALPVFVIRYLPDKEELKNKIKDIGDEFERNIEVKKVRKLEVERKIEFTINFENLVKAYILSWLLNRKSIYKKDEVELEKIKKIKEEIWERNFPIESNRIDVEINVIKNLPYSKPKDWKTYAEIIGKREESNIDKRNFFAHAGFEHNIIKIKIENQKIKLKINSKLESIAKNYLEDNLPGG